jgi:hypothetical protein
MQRQPAGPAATRVDARDIRVRTERRQAPGVRRSITIGMPYRGRSVMSGHASTRCPGTRCRRKCWASVHRFVDHHARIGQVREIGVVGRSLSEHAIELVLESPSRLGVLRQQVPRPRERQRCRFLPGQQERRDLHALRRRGLLHDRRGLSVSRHQEAMIPPCLPTESSWGEVKDRAACGSIAW